MTLNLDGSGISHIETGIGFLIICWRDFPSTVSSICIWNVMEIFRSTAIIRSKTAESYLEMRSKGIGDKSGIKRFGSCILPMDETLVLCAVDLSGRPYLVFDGEFTTERLGTLDTEMIREFFYAISYSAGMNLHIKVLSPGNNHHMAEAMFKAFARALDEAVSHDPRVKGILSTKGSL